MVFFFFFLKISEKKCDDWLNYCSIEDPKTARRTPTSVQTSSMHEFVKLAILGIVLLLETKF